MLAADSAEGNTRYLIDVQRFNYTVNKHGTHVFAAPIRVVGREGTQEGFVAIDGSGCLGAGGTMVFSIGKSTNHYWWAVGGNRIYDGVGATLCGVAAAAAQDSTANRGEVMPPVRANPARSF
jgi:hypothetical protein